VLYRPSSTPLVLPGDVNRKIDLDASGPKPKKRKNATVLPFFMRFSEK